MQDLSTVPVLFIVLVLVLRRAPVRYELKPRARGHVPFRCTKPHLVALKHPHLNVENHELVNGMMHILIISQILTRDEISKTLRWRSELATQFYSCPPPLNFSE